VFLLFSLLTCMDCLKTRMFALAISPNYASERCPSRRQERDGSVFIHHSGVSKLAQGDSAPERAWPGS
jgi:hypothetical protein